VCGAQKAGKDYILNLFKSKYTEPDKKVCACRVPGLLGLGVWVSGCLVVWVSGCVSVCLRPHRSSRCG
jgi:hypothetical protein